MSTWQRLGITIRRLRDERGLTQAELAARAKLSLVFIRKVEQGARMPSWLTLQEIARVLGTTVDVSLRRRRKRRR